MPLFDVSRLPNPSKGQLPKAEWFVTYSEALRVLAGVVEQGMGDPLETGLVRLARTVTVSGSYPAVGTTPNTYPIKFRSLHDYASAAGNQSVVKTDRHSDSAADDYVLNLASINGTWNDVFYIPTGTDLIVFGLGSKWFVWYGSPASTNVTVVTDIRVNGNNLEYKTRTITVPSAGTESAWTVWHEGTECT